jgi:hypothetical protein
MTVSTEDLTLPIHVESMSGLVVGSFATDTEARMAIVQDWADSSMEQPYYIHDCETGKRYAYDWFGMGPGQPEMKAMAQTRRAHTILERFAEAMRDMDMHAERGEFDHAEAAALRQGVIDSIRALR